MYKMTGCACNAASRVEQGMSYQFSKRFSAVIPVFKTFPPLGTRPTKRKAKHRRSTPHHEGGDAPPKCAVPAQRNRNNQNRP